MSSPRRDRTNREFPFESSRLQRDFELLDDLKRLVEQRTNIPGENRRAAPPRNQSFDGTPEPRPVAINSWTSQVPLTREPHPGEFLLPIPSPQKRIRATDQENNDNSVGAGLTHVQSRLQSSLGEGAEPLPAGLQKFLRQRPEPTQERRLNILDRRGLAMLGYTTLALISAGGISLAAVQLLSSRSTNIKSEESRTTGVGNTIPAITQPVAIVQPRLRLSRMNEVEGKPVFLGISIENPRAGSFIQIRGLPPDSLISKGSRVGSDSWRVPLQELANAMLNPPQNFVGTIALSVDLKNSDDVVDDSDVQRLSWSAADIKPASAPRADTHKNPRVSSLEGELPVGSYGNAGTVQLPAQLPAATRSVDEPQRPRATAQPARVISPSSIENLLSRANRALEMGDIAAARLLLQRAAEAGEVKAAMSLASTYDPAVLRRLRTLGAQPDLAAARRWYEKAAELGGIEATKRLRELR